jgi:hypothetical protein
MRSAGKDGAFIEFDSGLQWKRKQKAAGQTAAGGEIARLYQGARAPDTCNAGQHERGVRIPFPVRINAEKTA